MTPARLSPDSESERACRDCAPPGRSRGQGGTGFLLSPWPKRRCCTFLRRRNEGGARYRLAVPKEEEKFTLLSIRSSCRTRRKENLRGRMLMSNGWMPMVLIVSFVVWRTDSKAARFV